MTKRLPVSATIGLLIVFLCLAPAFTCGAATVDADALIQSGHWKRARAILEREVQAHPQDAHALYLLAQVDMADQDFAGALPLAQRAVALDGKNSNYHLKLGQIYGELAAQASFLSAPSLAVKFRKEVEIALQLDPNNVEALDSMMQFKFRAPGFLGGDKSEAQVLADKILRLNPSEGYIAKAELAELQKNGAEVEDDYQRAVDADPKSYHALTLLAGFYAHAPHAKYDLAAKYARQAIAVDPSRAEAYAILARVLVFEERWSDLDSILAGAQAKIPDDLAPYYEAANALVETGKDLPRAEGYAKKFLSEEPEGAEPDAADAHRLLGLVLEKEGRAAEARAEFQTALRLRPKFKAVREDLARVSR